MTHVRARIPTTHCGSLPRPAALFKLLEDRGFEREVEEVAFAAEVKAAVGEVVGRQVAAGIDIVSDGEMSKIGFFNYVKDRLTGFRGESGSFLPRDLVDFPEAAQRMFARGAGSGPSLAMVRPGNDGPIEYVGQGQLQADLANLREAIVGKEVEPFLPAVSPGTVVQNMATTHFASRAEYLYALADALRTEYRAIAGAGFILQVDCPDLAMDRHVEFADEPIEIFLRHVGEHVEVVNHALEGIDPARVRVHVCWGNYPGPHHRDVALAEIVDLVYRLDAAGLSVEAANPRHEHEWIVFREHPLPDGRYLVPGVIDTNSPYIEHPQVVSQRLQRFASVVGRENLVAGTDCGFATVATGTLTSDVVYAKLASLAEGARLASAELWGAVSES